MRTSVLLCLCGADTGRICAPPHRVSVVQLKNLDRKAGVLFLPSVPAKSQIIRPPAACRGSPARAVIAAYLTIRKKSTSPQSPQLVRYFLDTQTQKIQRVTRWILLSYIAYRVPTAGIPIDRPNAPKTLLFCCVHCLQK